MTTALNLAASDINLGNVVTVRGGSRRFVVVFVDRIIPNVVRYNLRALSGGQPGSGPSSMGREDLTLDTDQTVVFSGAQSDKRKRDAHKALLSTAASLGDLSVYQAVSANWR